MRAYSIDDASFIHFYFLLRILSFHALRILDLVFSLVSWNIFLSLCLTLFHACSYLEQFFNIFFPGSSHGLYLVSGVYSLSVFLTSVVQ
jgi:hypothetical protein